MSTTPRARTSAPKEASAPKVGRYYELKEEVAPIPDYVLTEKIRIKEPTREQMQAFWKAPAGEESDRVLLGDAADAVFALYAKLPQRQYNAMTRDIWNHFFPGTGGDEGKSEESSN
ncbi:hypothetical protein NONO_c60810 [Nocardia nova SH22a]|uniref:Tail assembly chaperone n=1 Tax=Nocardia nova SH22a TaxID=1415166 RepID=W5TNP5_9NOCA|nr:hypothetical protein [Nocardia nova]AHH20857.1 hypothetical protein NONO_c60810 [Nocardia nova SH22a]